MVVHIAGLEVAPCTSRSMAMFGDTRDEPHVSIAGINAFHPRELALPPEGTPVMSIRSASGMCRPTRTYVSGYMQSRNAMMLVEHTVTRNTANPSQGNGNGNGSQPTNDTGRPGFDKGEQSRSAKTRVDKKDKKQRFVWHPEYHQMFLEAVQRLGSNASPMRILKLMKIEGLTRDHVASHLQKYRDQLKKQQVSDKNTCPQRETPNVSTNCPHASVNLNPTNLTFPTNSHHVVQDYFYNFSSGTWPIYHANPTPCICSSPPLWPAPITCFPDDHFSAGCNVPIKHEDSHVPHSHSLGFINSHPPNPLSGSHLPVRDVVGNGVNPRGQTMQAMFEHHNLGREYALAPLPLEQGIQPMPQLTPSQSDDLLSNLDESQLVAMYLQIEQLQRFQETDLPPEQAPNGDAI